ncbi:hypothetical protein AGMMS50262_21950 [Bacteroidia bacterium]|nr:hypothetical protein AGMMS50262_21950 [Bacteroidia bacterium]
MKSKILFVLIFLCLPVWCNAQAIYKKNSIRYSGVEEKRIYHLYNKKKNPSCSIKINYFYPEFYTQNVVSQTIDRIFLSDFFGQEYVALSPKEAIKKYAENYINQYKEKFELSRLYAEESEKVKENEEAQQDMDVLYTQEKIMRNTIFFNQGDIISMVINVYEFTGGVHGSAFTRGSILDLRTGKKIKYEDVFYENTQDSISNLLYSNLLKARKYQSEDEMTADGFDFDTIPPTDNFVADDEGLTFIYDPYELGAYVLGIVEISVPYSDLVYYMKPECTLFRWAESSHAGNQIKFGTTVLQQDSVLIQFTYPTVYHNSTVLQKLQKVFVENAFGKEISSFSPTDAPGAFYNKEFPNPEKTTIYLQTNTFYYNWNNLISYTVEKPNRQEGFIVDMQTQKNCVFSDLFRPDSRKEIARLLKNEPTDNFYTDGNGITFIYSPTQKITLSYTEIEPFLRENSPLLHTN